MLFIGKKMEGEIAHSFKNFEFIEVNSKPNQSNYAFLKNLYNLEQKIEIPEGAVIHSQRPDWLVPFCGRKNRKIVTLHGSHAKNVFLKKGFLVGSIYSRLEKKGLACADAIISVSYHDANAYKQKYPFAAGKITVIPIGIDIDRFKNKDRKKSRKALGFSEEDQIVISVGRLEKEKSYGLLIKACHEARVKLLLVGRGREEEKLKQLAKNIGADVVFHEAVDHEKIPEILACGDVFALVSKHEGLPTVVIEALAAGLPIVATDVGDMRKLVIEGKTGYIVDESSLAEKLSDLFSLRIHSRDCITVAKKYLLSAISKEIINMYHENKKNR